MSAKLIDSNALAIILDSGSIKNDYIIYEINNELANAGIKPWKSIDAEIYACKNQTLIIARPSPPLCSKGFNVRIRRKR